MENQLQKDDLLWQTAKRRAGFKASMLVYVLVNFLLIGIWYATTGRGSYFWPVWPILGWVLVWWRSTSALIIPTKFFLSRKNTKS